MKNNTIKEDSKVFESFREFYNNVNEATIELPTMIGDKGDSEWKEFLNFLKANKIKMKDTKKPGEYDGENIVIYTGTKEALENLVEFGFPDTDYTIKEAVNVKSLTNELEKILKEKVEYIDTYDNDSGDGKDVVFGFPNLENELVLLIDEKTKAFYFAYDSTPLTFPVLHTKEEIKWANDALASTPLAFEKLDSKIMDIVRKYVADQNA